MKVKEGYCQAPDRDVRKLKCGYPLPCPWHKPKTILILVENKSDKNRGRR